jgi:hypothetical protein
MEHDSFIEQIASELKRPVRLDPRFDDRVMAAIENPEVIPLRPSLPRPWLLRPWTISVPRIGALAAAAAFTAFAAVSVWVKGDPTPGVAEVPAAESLLIPASNAGSNADLSVTSYTFLYSSRTAQKVAIVGDFNDWAQDGALMTRASKDGVWSVTIPLRAGRYAFQIVVDDSLRLTDPRLPVEVDDFGTANSIVTIPARAP